MRIRLASFGAIALLLGMAPLTAATAHASSERVGHTQPGSAYVLAGGGGSESTQPEGSGESTKGGAKKGETEPVAEEAGPPWTYQMARIVIVLLVLLLLAIGAIYYRLVASRRKGIA